MNKHIFTEAVTVEAEVLDWDSEELPSTIAGGVDLIL